MGAIRDEVSHCDELAVEDIDLEDDWKLLVLGSSIDAQCPIGEQIREKAKLITEVMGTAEISLEGMRWRPDYEINESVFCTEVLSPLLRRMGFVSVRYLHGVREYGKDFTFSELSPFSHLRHYGLQMSHDRLQKIDVRQQLLNNTLAHKTIIGKRFCGRSAPLVQIDQIRASILSASLLSSSHVHRIP